MIRHIIIAIDGPVASGKTTIGRMIARKLKVKFLDSGRLYRVVAYHSLGKDLNLGKLLSKINFELRGEKFFLDGIDVTKKLNKTECGERASVLSKQPILREWVNKTIKELAINDSIVVAGRDIGTVVLPNSHVKIFLTADPKVRAHRRFIDEKGRLSEEEILAALIKRDERDSKREIAPLKPSDDAVVIDSTNLSIGQVKNQILELAVEYLRTVHISKWWRFSHFVARNLAKWLFKIEIFGKGNIPATGPAIVVANHTSLLDVFFVGLALPRMGSYIAKEELFKIPVIRSCVKGYGAIPVKRGGVGKEMVRAVYSALKQNMLLTIFPEGTRSKTSKLTGKYHTGAIQFAHKTGAALIPAGIIGGHDVLPVGAKLPRKSKVTVNVGEPIIWNREETKPDSEFYEKILKDVITQIAKLSNQEPVF